MDHLLNFLLSAGLVALGVFVIRSLPVKYRFNRRMRRSSRDMKELVEETFAERPFKLPHGEVPGADLILIAKRAAPRFHQLLGGDEAALDMLEAVERAMGQGAAGEAPLRT